MRRAAAILLCVLLLCALAGCGAADVLREALTDRDTPTPEPWTSPAPLASGRGDGTDACYEGGSGELHWQVKDWTIYESWPAAGVNTGGLLVEDRKLGDVLLAEDGGGMLLAAVTVANESVPTSGSVWMYVFCLRPVVGETDAVGDYPVYQDQAGEVLIDGKPWNTAFYMPPEGESRELTLGWLLTAEEVTAARNGTLSLGCDAGQDDPEPLTLLPLVPD